MSKSKHIKNTVQSAVCQICGTEFSYLFVHKPKKFCTIKCYQKHHRDTNPEAWKVYRKTHRSQQWVKEKMLAYKKTPAQREKTNERKRSEKSRQWYRDYRKNKSATDPTWREKQKEYSRKARSKGLSEKQKLRKKIDKLHAIKNLRTDYVNDIIRIENPTLRGKPIPEIVTELKRNHLKAKRLIYAKEQNSERA